LFFACGKGDDMVSPTLYTLEVEFAAHFGWSDNETFIQIVTESAVFAITPRIEIAII
jgi:hypothetical protein